MGTDAQKRTVAMTTGGAVMSFETGGPTPQIRMMPARVNPATRVSFAAEALGAPVVLGERLRSDLRVD
jgi:hypothetical protein